MMRNQHQLELQTENKTEDTLNFREKIQRDSMIEALEKTNGNVSLAAKLLDVPRSTFINECKNISYKVDFVIYFSLCAHVLSECALTGEIIE